MTNSWDWVEKHNRQQRLRRRFQLFGGFAVILFMLFSYGIPLISSYIEDERKSKTSSPQKQTESVIDASKQRPAQPTATSQIQPKEASQTVTELPSSVFSSSLPEDPLPTPKLLRTVESLKAKLERQIEKLDGNNNRLEKFGGDKWKAIQEIVEVSLGTDVPAVVAEKVKQASKQLDALAADLDYAEFMEQNRGKDTRELLTAIIKFRDLHPNHPRLDELEQSLTQLSQEKWLTIAAEELREASPDDAGFSEGWLPIASAWQLVGNGAEARDAVRKAIESLPRMTLPERVVGSTIEICQHESFNRASAKRLVENATEICEQVSHRWKRGVYYAQLSGLSRQLDLDSQASDLLSRSLSLIDKKGLGSVWQKHTLTQEARAASWTESPETILTICSKIEKLNYPEPLVNANAYGHAAIAAARHGDRTQYLRATLLTENALAPVRVDDYPNYLYAVRLAEANILQRRWRAAVIVANNIPDPYVRASLLFRVMKDAPQEIRTKNLPKLFENFADQQWASPACAGYAEHRIRSGESLVSVAQWSQSLPLASQRAAAFAGVSRSVGTTTVAAETDLQQPNVVPVKINDVVSLVNEAERVANQIQDPLTSASVWIGIARTWNLLGKTQRYEQAITNLDDCLFDAWGEIWEKRPAVKRSYNGGYIYTNDQHRDDEKHTLVKIISCHRHLAEMQADLGDARGAMETCLNLANAAGFMNSTATYNEWNYLFMKALLNRLEGATNVGADSLPLLKHHSSHDTRALRAAWAKDVPRLEAVIPEVVKNFERGITTAAALTQPARAYGELAILQAERGNTEGYRDARRSAQSLITQGRANSEMKLVLATADALAGEFELAESNLVRGTLRWFGDANRPRSQLAVSLAAVGQWEKALQHAQKVSVSQPFYRAEAWVGVAEARLRDSTESQQSVLDWASSLESQLDKAAAYCGLALEVSGR